MDTPSILYDQLIDFKSIPDYNEFARRSSVIHSFAKATQTTDLLVDHFKRCTWLYHYNPEFIDLFGSFGSKLCTDNYIDTLVCPEDAGLFSQIISAINNCMRTDFLKGDRYYYFSFDIRLGESPTETRMFSLKVIPFIFTADLTPWISVYCIGETEKIYPGNLILHAPRQNVFFNFNAAENQFNPRAIVCKLSDMEKNILKFAAEGLTENEIAEALGIPVSSLKNQKTKMFNRLSVSSVSAAIALAYNRGLLE
jgi:DNA-binding CsgD family transcriptional regulator